MSNKRKAKNDKRKARAAKHARAPLAPAPPPSRPRPTPVRFSGAAQPNERLFVLCKVCQAPFPSPVQMDRASVEGGSRIEGMSYNCPQGHIAPYDMVDHFFAVAS